MRNDTYLYTDGLDAARRSGQIALWRASHQANIACKKAIEDSTRQGFDGVHLKEDCAKEVLEEFGFKRVNWVLANTIQEKSGDGRFRPDNRSWAQRTFIPEDMGHKVEFIVNSHSEVVNGFVNGRPIRSLTSSAQNTANPIHGRIWITQERCLY